MSKRKATKELSPSSVKQNNTSKVNVYYNSAKQKGKVYKDSPMKIGKQPINTFFIGFEGKYFPLR